MIIKQAVVDALNTQIVSEFNASAQYISIAIYFDDEGLPDLAGFFYRQAEEERTHAMKFIHFMLEAGTRPVVPASSQPQGDFKDAAAAVQYALDQELKVTNEINNLVSLSTKESDHTTYQFLQWFVTEQVEEVSSMSQLLQTIKHANGNLLLVEDYVRRTPQHATGEAGGEAA